MISAHTNPATVEAAADLATLNRSSRMNTGMGIVTVNNHTVELPEADARVLFLAITAAARHGGAIAISPDTTVNINQATQSSITISSGFTDEFNPEADWKRFAGRNARAVQKLSGEQVSA